jgi:hypothetical protein
MIDKVKTIDSLDKLFNVENNEASKEQPMQLPSLRKSPELQHCIDDDYYTTRQNLFELLAQGQEALDAALEIAKQSEHPRAFEVVGNLMKQIADINHQLIDLSVKVKSLSKDSKDNITPNNVTNTAIFVGPTSNLNKMIHDLLQSDNEDIQ